MAAGVPVVMVPVVMGMLVAMSRSLVAVLMPVMAMRLGLMGVLMLMFVFIVTAHFTSLLSL
jgi:hypothetical protein